MSHSRQPSHGRGTAASQGEAIRIQRERQEEKRRSQLKSDSTSNHSSAKRSSKQIDKSSKPIDRSSKVIERSSKQIDSPIPKKLEQETEKISSPTKAKAPIAPAATSDEKIKPRREATRDPSGRGLKIEKRIFNATGIDNLALLLETEAYQPACFSIYRFKTVLDQKTVHDFFHALMYAYPRFAYLVELDPSKAGKHNKEAMASAVDPSQRDSDRLLTEKEKKALNDKKKGRKTRYSKSLKAGGLLRPAKFRHDPRFSIDNQIEEVDCPGKGSDEDLNVLAGNFLARHFDYTKPLWEALVVRNIKESAEGTQSALLIKVHHTLSDGQGMIAAYHTVLTAMATGKPVSHVQAKFDAATAGRRNDSAKSEEKKEETKAIGQRGIKPTVWGTTKHLFHTVRGLYFSSRKSFQYTNKSAPRAAGRLYSQSEGILMSDIKLIRQAFSTEKTKLTLNDVACAVLTRAMRIAGERTEAKKGKKIKDKRFAIFIPISVRPKGDWSLNNFTTGGIAWFRFTDPKTSENSFEELLSQVNREMNRIKTSHIPRLWYGLFDTFCKRRFFFLPNYPVFRGFFNKAYKEYSVATNVPGPNQPVKFGEHEAHSYHVLPPSSPGKATMAIGMISYGGHFSVAVSVDDVPEFQTLPQDICKAFQDSAAELVDAAKKRLGKEK